MSLHLKSSLLAALLALSSLSACGEDHRSEDFCNMICDCTSASAEEQEQCSAGCLASVDAAEESSGVSPVSDACYACVNNNSCLLVESSCANDCAALADAFNEPEPVPGDSN